MPWLKVHFGPDRRININTLEFLTETAVLEHSPCKSRLWDWFSGSRFSFTAPDCTPVDRDEDHGGGDALFTEISGRKMRDIGQNRRSFKV